MLNKSCPEIVCFIALDPAAPAFFGFSEYLAGLALMVIAWMIADMRYRFRLRATPFPLLPVSFYLVLSLGILTLTTDLWRAEGWRVPHLPVFTPGSWQGFLGALLLLTFLSWAWVALIRPPVYGRWNAKQYAYALYDVILKGSPGDLAIIADELRRSAPALVTSWARPARKSWFWPWAKESNDGKPPPVAAYANDLLLLIADKKFCRAMVAHSPVTAQVLFHTISEERAYDAPVEAFARNFVEAAFEDPDSFIYHESSRYESGLLGYHQPITQALFGDAEVVERVGTLLDVDYKVRDTWGPEQWEAYCRVCLIALEATITQRGIWAVSTAVNRFLGKIRDATRGLHTINKTTGLNWNTGPQANLYAVTHFIREAVRLLDEAGVPQGLLLRVAR